jgi:hypothetical protein
MEHIAERLAAMVAELRERRDWEVVMAAEGAGQYVQDHRDAAAYRQIDRQVDALAKAWDRMIALLEKTGAQAQKIEASCENFYGD